MSATVSNPFRSWSGIALAVLASVAFPETLKLKDGTVLQGTLVSREDSLLIFRSGTLGELRVPVSAVAPEPAKSGGDPSDQALFFMPTAFTPARGSFMFRDFELLFLTFGYAPTASTTLTGGFLFPVSSEVQLGTFGFKQKIFDRPADGVAVALTGNVTKPLGEIGEELGLVVNSNLVAGLRNGLAGLHAALGFLGAEVEDEYYDGTRPDTHWERSWSLGMGAEIRLTPHSKLMAEYLSVAPFDPDQEIDGGLLTLGFRLHGARLSADIAGMRPLGSGENGGLIFLPLLVVSYRI